MKMNTIKIMLVIGIVLVLLTPILYNYAENKWKSALYDYPSEMEVEYYLQPGGIHQLVIPAGDSVYPIIASKDRTYSSDPSLEIKITSVKLNSNSETINIKVMGYSEYQSYLGGNAPVSTFSQNDVYTIDTGVYLPYSGSASSPWYIVLTNNNGFDVQVNDFVVQYANAEVYKDYIAGQELMDFWLPIYNLSFYCEIGFVIYNLIVVGLYFDQRKKIKNIETTEAMKKYPSETEAIPPPPPTSAYTELPPQDYSPSPPKILSSPQPPTDVSDRLRKITELKDNGLITDDEFKAKKEEILRNL